jgi:hypothetical protein
MGVTVYTPAEVGALLRRPGDWVVDQALAGVIPGRKVGRFWRFTEDDIRAYLDSVATTTPKPRQITRRRRVA